MEKGEYNYQTGEMKIDFDYHFIKQGTICELRKNAPRALVGEYGCSCCGHNKGSEYVGDYVEDEYETIMFFTKCSHPDAKNDDFMDSRIKAKYYKELKHQALCALDN